MNTARESAALKVDWEKNSVSPVELNRHQYCTWLWEIINNTIRNLSRGLSFSGYRLSRRMHLERPALQAAL